MSLARAQQLSILIWLLQSSTLSREYATLQSSFNERPFQNIATGQSDKAMFHHNLTCIEKGTLLLRAYRKDRLETKLIQLFVPIKRYPLPKEPTTEKLKIYDVEKETLLAVQYIEYGHCREFTAKDVLLYELTSLSFFLVDKMVCLKKREKHRLGKELRDVLKEDTGAYPPASNCLVIDFMAFI